MSDPEEDYYKHNYLARKHRDDRETLASMGAEEHRSITAVARAVARTRTIVALRAVFKKEA